MIEQPPHYENCLHCGGTMDVSALAPFTLAECPHCGTNSRVHSRLGHYELLARLGFGGMSLVFQAQDLNLGREVALKILNEECLSDGGRVTQFEKEAQITASLSHPSIVKVYTVGESRGRFFIAMELIRGESLESWMRREAKLPEKEILQIALQVVDGLSAAYTAGLIHRDIKPGNLLLDERGKIKIVDFGLALLTEEGLRDKEIWATPYYVPPETLEGKEEDFRSDLYALGSTLYHALSGVAPCSDSVLKINDLKIAKQKISSLGTVAPWLHASTQKVVDIAMAYDADDRFESYERFAEALKIALHCVETGGASPPIYSSVRMKKRHQAQLLRKKMIWIGGGVMAITTLGLGGYFLLPKKTPAVVIPPDTKNHNLTDLTKQPFQSNLELSGEEISQRYAVARQMLENKEYDRAAKEFRALVQLNNIPIQTASWVGFEAAACYFQEGKSGEARAALKELREVIAKIPEAERDDQAKLADLMAEKIMGFEPILANNWPRQEFPLQLLGNYVAGLKNWEQGILGPAHHWFNDFSKTQLTEATQSLSVYQKRALAYLSDSEKLANSKPSDVEEDLSRLDAERAKLDELEGALQTKGRARFLQREWTLRVAKRQKAARDKQAAQQLTQNTGLDAWLNFESYCKSWNFKEAAAVLESHKSASPRYEAAHEIARLSAEFMEEIQRIIAIEPRPILENSKKEKIGTWVKGDALGLWCLRSGEEKYHPWSSCSAAQFEQLFTEMARKISGQEEKTKRYHQLIAFQVLSRDSSAASAVVQEIKDIKIRQEWMKKLASYLSKS